MKKTMRWLKLILKNHLKMIIVILFLFILIALYIYEQLYGTLSEMVIYSIIRFLLGILLIIMLKKLHYAWMIKTKRSKSHVMMMLPAVLIAIHNFPVSAWIQGRLSITVTPVALLIFLIECLSIAFFEEIIFRGILLGLCIELFKHLKLGVWMSIVLSSIIFGAFHLINLFSGVSAFDVMLQAFYTLLIGMVWAIIYMKSKNLAYIVVLHTLFNFFGLLAIEFGNAHQRYDLFTLISTSLIMIGSALFYFNVYKKITPQEMMQWNENETMTRRKL